MSRTRRPSIGSLTRPWFDGKFHRVPQATPTLPPRSITTSAVHWCPSLYRQVLTSSGTIRWRATGDPDADSIAAHLAVVDGGQRQTT